MQQDKVEFFNDLRRSRHADLVYRAYCHYYVIKKKCQYNVYEKAESILEDVQKCEELLKQVRNFAPNSISFMQTEIPFLN